MNKSIDFNTLNNEQLVSLVQTGIYAQKQYDMKKTLDPHFDKKTPEILELKHMMDVKDEAVRVLYEKNKGLIETAKKMSKSHLAKEDVDQFADEAFYIAIQNYNPSNAQNAAFSTYALPTIIERIQRKDFSIGMDIHVPRAKRQFIAKIKAVQTDFMAKNKRPMSDEECAKALNITLEELHNYINMSTYYELTSLDEVINDDEGTTVGDLIQDDSTDLDKSDRIDLIHSLLMKYFNEEERYIICSLNGIYGYEKKSEQKIADEQGLTRSRVSQKKLEIEKRLHRLIKEHENV